MQSDHMDGGPILRLFQVKTKAGCAEKLLSNFATTSADVVRHEHGNKGYFFGRGIAVDADIVVFASIWENLEAIKQRFGTEWQTSYLPPGYETLIEECSIRHIDMNSGWHVDL